MPATEQRIALPARYRVVRHIANGGMAGVWAVEDEVLRRLVAVKVLAPAYAVDQRAMARFTREARAAARLGDCRHVVTIYDIGEHEGRAFIVMEHLAGGTIADRLRSGTPITRPQAVRWLQETATALDCAHAHDVVHRDVKPANLLLDERGRLAVGDFGIATVASEVSLTQTGQVMGTAAYISPEQARGEPATAASDRYALAVVAYELLTGQRPFVAEHPAAQARAHVEATVPAASAAAAGLPAALDAVLERGLAKDPAQRPHSAAALADELEAALGPDAEAIEDPTDVTRPVAPVAVPRRPREPATPRSRGAGGVGLAALAAIALGVGAIVAIALSGGDGGRERAQGKRPATTSPSAPADTQATTESQPPARSEPAPAEPTPADRQPGEDPKALNDQGFELIQRGSHAEAVAPLQRSVDGFRTQDRRGEIDYAFALFNLASALRQSGRPADAIPLLEERLQISDFKRGVVKRELKLAQQQAGSQDSGPQGDG